MSLPRPLSGPRLPPLKGAPAHLVVLVHGYGADGKDLIRLAPQLQRHLPTAAFVAPDGPERCPGAGYQWFPISRLDPHEMHKGVEAAAPVFEAFLDAELARLGLAADRLVLAGFSQGTMMSLHVGLARAIKPAAIVGFSGVLTGAAPKAGADAPPLLLTHGDADAVIPAEALFLSAGTLGHAGYAVQWHLVPGMGHGIDPSSLDLAGRFLALACDGRFGRTGSVSCAL